MIRPEAGALHFKILLLQTSTRSRKDASAVNRERMVESLGEVRKVNRVDRTTSDIIGIFTTQKTSYGHSQSLLMDSYLLVSDLMW